MAEKRKIHSLTINVASNGYSVDCNYEHNRDEPFSLDSSKPKIAKTMDELLDIVEDELEGTKEGSREEHDEEQREKPKVRILGVRMIRRDKMKKHA